MAELCPINGFRFMTHKQTSVTYHLRPVSGTWNGKKQISSGKHSYHLFVGTQLQKTCKQWCLPCSYVKMIQCHHLLSDRQMIRIAQPAKMTLNLRKRAQPRYNESYSTVNTSAVFSPMPLCSHFKLCSTVCFIISGCAL